MAALDTVFFKPALQYSGCKKKMQNCRENMHQT